MKRPITPDLPIAALRTSAEATMITTSLIYARAKYVGVE
jgi:hypothetical protein